MNWKTGVCCVWCPSFEEGTLRPINRCHATVIRAQRGSHTPSQQASDLPGRAEFKVAWHCLIGASTPPRRRGNVQAPNCADSKNVQVRYCADSNSSIVFLIFGSTRCLVCTIPVHAETDFGFSFVFCLLTAHMVPAGFRAGVPPRHAGEQRS